MAKLSNEYHRRLLEKKHMLDAAKSQLKKEFIGLDHIIDQVVDYSTSWFLFPQLQDKPLVINLWGLTGTGKTSLINRFVKLINYTDYYYRFDLGEKEGAYSFREKVDDMCENEDGVPVIVAFDEFQHNRTLDENGGEIEKEYNRKVWEFIDSGIIYHFNYMHGMYTLEMRAKLLDYMLKSGVVVENGMVVKGKELFKHETFKKKSRTELHFIDQTYYEDILQVTDKYMGIHLLRNLEDYLLTLNGEQSVDFMLKVARKGNVPVARNFSKSLIFVIGNMDEAYKMSSDLNPDMEADEFHAESLKISVPKIKRALKLRFRNEQVSRLGNIHIIYPAMNRDAYQQIIGQQLDKICKQIKDEMHIQLDFDDSVHTTIYNEGVFPTQGTRPVFTTINQLIRSNVSILITRIISQLKAVDTIHIKTEEDRMIATYYSKNKKVDGETIKLTLNMHELRRNKKDDLQAITAVHESGHAILFALLNRVVPEVVYSGTTEPDTSGFVFSKNHFPLITWHDIIPRAAALLGGMAAERIVFGEGSVTNGSESDISNATRLISTVIKSSGMGKMKGEYRLAENPNNYYLHDHSEVEQEIGVMLQQAYELAIETLQGEERLLIRLSNYLSDHRKIQKEELKTFIENYKSDGSSLHLRDRDNPYGFRDRLKAVNEEMVAKGEKSVGSYEKIYLNKNIDKEY